MIGYGNTVPKSDSGKLAVIFYAMVGIPVYIFYLMNMGKIFARFLKWIYTKAYRWNVRRKWRNEVNYRPNVNGGENQDLDEAYLDELEKQVRQNLAYDLDIWEMIICRDLLSEIVIHPIFKKQLYCISHFVSFSEQQEAKPYRKCKKC